jgi:hypothetical protein
MRREIYRSFPVIIGLYFITILFIFILPFHSRDPQDQYLDEDRYFVANGRLGHGFIKCQSDAIISCFRSDPNKGEKKNKLKGLSGNVVK